MKKITDQMKKSLILGIGILISIFLIVLIARSFMQNPELELSDAAITTPVNNISTEKISIENPLPSEKEVIKEIIVEPIVIPDEPTEENSAVDKGTEQTIQGDIPEKPVYTEAELTDPTQKPTGEKVEPDKKDVMVPTKPIESSQEQSKPKASSGLPGFENVPNAGANEVIEANDMYENGNKVGNMD